MAIKPGATSGVASALLGAVVVMVLPVAISFRLVPAVQGLFVPMLALAWVVQCVAIFVAVRGMRATIAPKWVLLLLVMMMNSAMTIFGNGLNGLPTEGRDLLNMLGRAVNCLIFVALLENVRVPLRDLVRFMYGFLGFAGVAIIYNVAANVKSLTQWSPSASVYLFDFASFFGNRNQFGAFLMVSIVAHAFVIAQTRMKARNLVLLAAQCLSLFMTFSRGALLGVSVFVALFLLLRVLVLGKFDWRVVSFFLILPVVAVLRWSSLVSVFAYVARPEVGLTNRDVLWSAGVALVNEFDAWIHGLGMFTGLRQVAAQGFEHSQFHSMYVDMLVNGGLIEVVLTLGIVGYAAVRMLRGGAPMVLRLVWLAGTVAVLILAAFESLSFFSIGYTDTLCTVFFVSVPILLGNVGREVVGVRGFEGGS